MTTASQTKEVKNTFNELAYKLGCRARLGGNAKKVKFEMWIGTYTKDNYEVVVGISLQEFDKLISKFPELYNF
jgi:hypothetical protein